MPDRARAGVPRRTVIASALCLGVLPFAGCGIRLEDDAPRVPLVPTRTPVPVEAELVALTRDTRALAALAATVAGPLAADLTTIHRRQHTVLRTTLLRRQVPAAELDADPSPAASPPPNAASPSGDPVPSSGAAPSGAAPRASASPGASASPTPSTSASPSAASRRAALGDAEGAAAEAAGTFAGVEEDLRATVAALHAQRFAAATLLSGREPEVPGDPVSGTAVAALAASTSAAIYFFEVVSARSSGRQRERSDETLAVLRDLRTDQLAGGSRPDDAIGHPLPFEVETTADAARLAREVLTTLRAGYGEQLAPLVGSEGAAGLAAVTRWLGTVEVEVHRWGLELVPFPGLE
ncbi:hypothetical protein GCM10023168_11190 [Fodinibacter luteus]|uniref:DUF4439 domain-containing protein n=1 Tax=Fodinibacter luteus TaxID=552064 RepID=A0ABP8K6M0_9MICO